MSVIVSKFGGSSVKDATAMRRCAEIVRDNPNIGVVILSATYNTTNQLETMAQLAINNKCEESLSLLRSVKERHYQIAEELSADQSAYQLIDEILLEGESLLRGIYLLKELSDRAMDRLYSIGERMSSALFAGVLKSIIGREVELVDARDVLKTNSDFKRALPDVVAIKEGAAKEILPLLNEKKVVVTQGFIGSNHEGATTTLGREGSDFSAALIGEAICASEIQIWTDVTGIYSTDPRIVSEAFKIDELSYDEASNMAQLGAKVLYPETLAPAKRGGIPVYVGSSLCSTEQGTWIRDCVENIPALRAVAKTDGHLLVNLRDLEGRPKRRFHKIVLDILDRNRAEYESIYGTTSGITILFAEKFIINNDLLVELERESEIVNSQAVSRISIIGNELEKEAGVVSKIMKGLEQGDINIIRFNGSSNSLSFFVTPKNAGPLLINLHSVL